jgi:uncharacterized protein
MTTLHEREVFDWRARRRVRLTAPDGWLSLIALEWLAEGPTSLGSDPSNDIVLPPSAPARVAVLEVADGRVVARVDAGAAVMIDDQPAGGRVPMRDDGEGRPTVLRVGAISFHVIVREGRLALRVRDATGPARDELAPLEYFPIDARWRVEAGFRPYDPPKRLPVPTVLEVAETYLVPGELAFEAGGHRWRLKVFQEQGETDLFIVFADQTNGVETYRGGRYLYAKPAGPSGTTVVDFNQAYNPPCVFTPFATCALPLPDNRLRFRVEAGEKRYRPTRRSPS